MKRTYWQNGNSFVLHTNQRCGANRRGRGLLWASPVEIEDGDFHGWKQCKKCFALKPGRKVYAKINGGEFRVRVVADMGETVRVELPGDCDREVPRASVEVA